MVRRLKKMPVVRSAENDQLVPAYARRHQRSDVRYRERGPATCAVTKLPQRWAQLVLLAWAERARSAKLGEDGLGGLLPDAGPVGPVQRDKRRSRAQRCRGGPCR